MSRYQLAVIGAGPGGYVAALRAADLGLKVCVVEEVGPGGTCLRVGCIPTKALIRSAEVFHLAARAGDYGVRVPGPPEVDWPALLDRKDRVVALLQRGIQGLFRKRGVELLTGRGRLVDDRRIEITAPDGSTAAVEAEKVVVATGSLPVEVPAFPFDGERILTSDHLTRLKRMPRSLLVVGGGYIGCELACLFAELGAKVVLVEMLDRLLAGMDEDLSRFALRILRKKRVEVRLGARLASLERSDGGVRGLTEDGRAVEAELALVAVGRRPNSAGLGLEELGVELDSRGAVVVDGACRSRLEHLYAVGDVTGGTMLAHVASRQGIAAAEDAAGRPTAPLDRRKVPAAVFLHPELASVGLSEAEARAQCGRVKVVNVPQQILGRDQAEGEPGGFVKIVADEQTGAVLGVHIAGHRASDLIHEAVLAINSELLVEDLAAAVHAHPTFSEGLMEAAQAWLDRGIHAAR